VYISGYEPLAQVPQLIKDLKIPHVSFTIFSRSDPNSPPWILYTLVYEVWAVTIFAHDIGSFCTKTALTHVFRRMHWIPRKQFEIRSKTCKKYGVITNDVRASYQ